MSEKTNTPSEKLLNTQLLIRTNDVMTGVDFYHVITVKDLIGCSTDCKVHKIIKFAKPRKEHLYTPTWEFEMSIPIPDRETGLMFNPMVSSKALIASAQENFSSARGGSGFPGIDLLIPLQCREW